jgi:hypothetical protein
MKSTKNEFCRLIAAIHNFQNLRKALANLKLLHSDEDSRTQFDTNVL